ncbi:MAG: hypothetical protein JWQ90_3341 [Hydrocarboniphaga sp.]|uniref:hypothetical protein n=1 Tax=Hydrocarboniphaga sp. TaxID=2033016 RepID=UPI00262A6773|nr:hypothetical protein [Hydrocarboniphaga sp.]MDB5970891.1 hypothetical protein [Hydrocarboniphaga sp.]
MLTTVATVTLRILFFRAGPQDLPYAPTLTRLLIPFALVVNFALASLTLPSGLAAVSAAMAVLGLSVTTRSLLRLRNMENRYTQTFQALLLTSTLIALAFIAPLSQLMPEILKIAQNPQLIEQNPAALNLPAGPVLLFDLLLIWNFAVSAHVYRQAADLKLVVGVLVSMLVSISLLMFVGFATSVIGSLLGLAQPAVGAGVGG